MNRNMSMATAMALGAIATSFWRSATAVDVHCLRNLGAVTVDGNVLIAVPCEMNETRVKGNVRLYAGGSLVARGVDIDGDIRGDTAFEVEITDSIVRGNIQLEDLVGDDSVVADTDVDGNIRLKDNRSFVQLADNDVRRNIEATDNRGGIDIIGNTVNGNLQCKGNQPAPTGGNNTVGGKSQDQCAQLSAASSDDSSDGPSAPTPPSGGSGGSTPSQPTGGSGGSTPPQPTGGSTNPPPAGTTGGPFNPVTEHTTGGGGGGMDSITLLLLSMLACVRAFPRRTRLRPNWAKRDRLT